MISLRFNLRPAYTLRDPPAYPLSSNPVLEGTTCGLRLNADFVDAGRAGL